LANVSNVADTAKLEIMTTVRTTFNQHNLKKGDKVFLFGSWNGFETRTIQFYVQEYTIHSIGKKQCYLIIGDDVLSRQSFYCEHPYGIATTQEKATELCALLMDEIISTEIEVGERINTSYSQLIVSNCKNGNREIIFNPRNK
jgi:hypothetical protein